MGWDATAFWLIFLDKTPWLCIYEAHGFPLLKFSGPLATLYADWEESAIGFSLPGSGGSVHGPDTILDPLSPKWAVKKKILWRW